MATQYSCIHYRRWPCQVCASAPPLHSTLGHAYRTIQGHSQQDGQVGSGQVSFLLASDLAASRSAVGPWGLALAGPKDHLIALIAMIGQTFGLHGSRSSSLMQHYCAVLRLVELTLCPDLAAERPNMEHRKKVLLEPSKAGNGVCLFFSALQSAQAAFADRYADRSKRHRVQKSIKTRGDVAANLAASDHASKQAALQPKST